MLEYAECFTKEFQGLLGEFYFYKKRTQKKIQTNL